MAAIAPYQFADLPQLTRAEATLYATAAQKFADGPSFARLGQQVSAVLSEVLRDDIKLAAGGHQLLSGSQLSSSMLNHACVAWLQANQSPEKIFWDIQPELAAFLIDTLLGGEGGDAAMHQPISDMGCGLLAYILLRVVYMYNHQQPTKSNVVFTLDRITSGKDALVGALSLDSYYHVLELPIQCGRHQGTTRLCIPSPLLNAFPGSNPTAKSGGQAIKVAAGTWAWLETYSTTLTLQIASLDLLPQDLANVEAGDIVLLEHHSLQLAEQHLQGSLRGKLGQGRTGSILGELCRPDPALDNLSFQVRAIDVSELPEQKVVPVKDSTTAVDTIEPANQTLLQEINTPMVVELARLRLSAAEVARLRLGQTLPLSRNSREPVDLVVGNMLYARGELVNVDGELGVRLIELLPGGQAHGTPS